MEEQQRVGEEVHRPNLDALRCIGCGAGGLRRVAEFLACPACGRSYPVQAEVPVMIADALALRGPLMEPAVVDATLRALGLPAEPVDALRVRRASGARAQFMNSAAEGGCAPFLARLRAAGFAVPDDPALESGAAADDDAVPKLRWQADYIPRAMQPGQRVLANVRLQNVGTVTLRHTGPGRVTIATEWQNERGEIVPPTEERRTPLPCDLPPGEAVTMPVFLRPPLGAGTLRLTLKPVQEDVRWLQPDYGPVRIHLRSDAVPGAPAHWGDADPADPPPRPDPAVSLDRLRDWLGPAGPAPLVLELGGAFRPLVAQRPSGAYVTGPDLLAMQIGCIAARAWDVPVPHVCADPARLPFPPDHFDAAVIFASLRLCPDPAAALRGLAAHLRPGGFIGLFCEPVGQAWPGPAVPDFMAPLRPGDRAPHFSLAEYAAIFRDARVQAADVVLEGGALTARLVPCA